MLQEILKETTKPYHDELEQLMYVHQIMDGSLTPAQYQKLLITNYLSHAYFEQQLFESLSPALKEELNINERIKLPALTKDMEESGIPIPESLPNANITPISNDDASLLGAMYVLEGATLGGHVIVKRLLVNPNLQPLNLHYHYYQLYGEELINKWKQFVQVLNTRVTPGAYNQSAESAKNMFENMKAFSKVAGLSS